MERPSPPLSPSISPIPEQEPPSTSPYSADFLFCFLVIYFIVSLTFLLTKFIYNQLFPGSTSTTTATDAPQPLRSNQVIVYIDDSSALSSSTDAKVGPSELGSCVICLEEMVEGEGARVLPRCRHVYHQACIDQWLMLGSEICPICRDRVMVRWTRKSRISHTQNGNDGENSSSSDMHRCLSAFYSIEVIFE